MGLSWMRICPFKSSQLGQGRGLQETVIRELANRTHHFHVVELSWNNNLTKQSSEVPLWTIKERWDVNSWLNCYHLLMKIFCSKIMSTSKEKSEKIYKRMFFLWVRDCIKEFFYEQEIVLKSKKHTKVHRGYTKS